MQRFLTTSSWLFIAMYFCVAGYSQEKAKQLISPEKAGFKALTIENKFGPVRYFVSTEGKPLDESKRLPLIVYLDGSGPSPLYWTEDGRLSCSLMFDPQEFPNYHFAVISKPGIQFCEKEKRVSVEEYDEKMSLRWRVDAAHAVINQLAAKEFIDTKRIIVIGHSQGADVAPWVALENKHVTHVVGLAAGGMSLMHDFIATMRKEIAAGKMSAAEGEAQILDIKSDFQDIFNDPESTTKKWSGEAYLMWSTFFQPGLEAWTQIEKPIYLGLCQFDVNTPVESGEAIQLEFIRLGKKNMTSKVWPCDHYFVQPTAKDPKVQSRDIRLEALREILEWAKKS